MPAFRPAGKVVRCAVYCRISLARLGETVKVEDQRRICLDLAAQRGWQVEERHIYTDNSKSAWQHNRRRPGWDSMLGVIDNGEIDAIIVYHGDRLIRQPYDLELLLRIADARGMRLAAPTGDRDLDNPDDRFILRVEAAANCRESDAISRRTKRHYDRLAEKGKVRLGGRGGRAYGFEADSLTLREDEADVIREAAKRVLAGEPVGAICRDFNARGLRHVTGNEWDHGALKKLLLRPRLAGLVAHRGEIIGEAAWPPILDRATWEGVCAVLERKAGNFSYATNARRYLLTGVARCGPCGEPVAIRHNTRGMLAYGCINPSCAVKVSRAVRHVDAFVEGAMIRLLNDPAIRSRLRPAESGHLAAELRALEAQREKILSDFADDDDPDVGDMVRVKLRRNREKTEDVRRRIAESERTHALGDLWGIDLTGWRALGLARQRTAVEVFMTVTILPTGRRGPGFDPTSIRLEQRK